MATVGLAEAEPLLEALHDPSADTRVAVLDALTHLPLDRDCWLGVREYLRWALNDRTAPEHTSAIALAARVPVSSIRSELCRLAEAGDREERREAAFALADAADERAVEPLLALLDDAVAEVDAAKHLARLDVSPAAAAVRHRADATRSPEARFWLALALARAGDGRALELTVLDFHTNGVQLDLLSGDPEPVRAELRRGGRLPGPMRARLAQLSPDLSGDAARLVELILEADQAEQAPAEQTADSAEPVAVREDIRARVRAALDRCLDDEPAPGWQELVKQAVGEVSAASGSRAGWAAAVSDLFRRTIAHPSPVGYLMGNEIVMLAHEAPGFGPDLDGLLEAYRPLAVEGTTGGTGAQVAWTAARAGLPHLVAGLAPKLAVPEDRLPAAHLLAAAAGYVGSDFPPIFGGVPTPPTPPVQGELIDDMTGANGGGEPRTRGLARAQPPEPEKTAPRWILARVSDVERPEVPLQNAFRAGAAHEIAIAIGPTQEGMLAATGGEAFDEALGDVPGVEQLFVTFIPPPAVSPPLTGSLFLPPTGTSRPCSFGVRLPNDLATFEAQIQVYHRNRMVQMALLRGPVVADPVHAPAGSRIELQLAVIRPGTADLADRPRFDAAMARTSAATTGVADATLAVFDNDRIDHVVPTLRQILTRVATGDAARRGRLEDPGVVDDLRALAFQGCELHTAIAGALREEDAGRPLERLQVLVEDACDFFPVEFVYELPAPRRDAGLCPGWRTGLRTGACPEPHDPQGARGLAEHVCPTGFWALSKVVERHVVGKESWNELGLRGADFALRSWPTAERRSLDPPRVSLFAASNRVDSVRKGQIAGVRKTLERIAEDAAYAETWDGWVDEVGRRKPSLLVLLSHTADEQFQAALEVGAGDLCLISQVQPGYVRASDDRRPVVLLLGCETAVADFGLQTFVAKFQDLGACLVVGTVASVLGQRAAPVARTIAAGLVAASRRPRPISAGEFLRAIRRKLLARGELTALCLTAFGDADWQLGGT